MTQNDSDQCEHDSQIINAQNSRVVATHVQSTAALTEVIIMTLNEAYCQVGWLHVQSSGIQPFSDNCRNAQ